MGGKASKKRSEESSTRQSVVAPAGEELVLELPGQSTEPERLDSNTRGDCTESTEAASSSKQAGPKEVVEVSNAHEVAAVTTATEQKTPCEPRDDEELIESSHWLAFREIFVQYIPGKPHALTEFGAHLYSRRAGGHEFRALDGTGLARTVGLRNRDELLSINNLQTEISKAEQLAVLECFSDIGIQIGLVIKRNREETWLFAFHLNEKDNRPVVENIFSQRLDAERWDNSFIKLIPVDSAFTVIPDYSYQSSRQVQMVLEKDDRFMEIDTNKATYVLHKQTVTLNYYQRINGSEDEGYAVSISTPESSDSDCDKEEMCIEAVDAGPLSVIVFPPYMTEPCPIPQNNMFFIVSFLPTGATAFKAANIQGELYISSDEADPMLWVASLSTNPSEFRIVSGDNVLEKREDFLKLFKSQDG